MNIYEELVNDIARIITVKDWNGVAEKVEGLVNNGILNMEDAEVVCTILSMIADPDPLEDK